VLFRQVGGAAKIRVHNNRGIVLLGRGWGAEALAAFEEALGIQEKLVADYPIIADYRRELGMSYNNQGILLHRLGRRQEALAAFGKGIDIKAKLAADSPTIPEYRRNLAGSYLNQANLLRDLGRHADAEAASRAAVGAYQRLVQDFPAIPDYRLEWAVAQGNHGIMLFGLRRLGAALAATESAVHLLEKLVADFPTVPAYALELGKSSTHLGEFLLLDGRPKAALGWYAKAITALEPMVARDARQALARRALRIAFQARARALTKLTRYAEALKDWDYAVALEPGPERTGLRLERAACLARGGSPALAVAEVSALTANARGPAGLFYNAACVCALAAAATKSEGPLAGRYADRAVALLRRAVAGGFHDLAHLQKDQDLAALRPRKEFQTLLAELGAKRPK
jgi:tetratricopeptide (TPR) repeat protein